MSKTITAREFMFHNVVGGTELDEDLIVEAELVKRWYVRKWRTYMNEFKLVREEDIEWLRNKASIDTTGWNEDAIANINKWSAEYDWRPVVVVADYNLVS